MYYVYVLKSETDSKFYIGYSENLKKRVGAHCNGSVIATKNRRPIKLVYYEAYVNKADAKCMEKFLKSGSGYTFLKKQLMNYLREPTLPTGREI